MKKQKTSKDVEPLRGSKSKESKSSSSKGSKSQSKSYGKSTQAEKPVFETTDTEIPLNQGEELGNTNDQPNIEAASKDNWFKKPERPSTPDSDWNTTKSIGFRPPQTWISKVAKARKPPLTFDELMSTPIDFSAHILHNQKIENLTQEHLSVIRLLPIDLTRRTLKDTNIHLTSASLYHLIENQGSQVVPANYFINNDLEYLKGGSSSRKYTTSTTKTMAAKYDTIEGIKDKVPSLWSPVKVAYDKYAIWGITHKRQKFYGYASNRQAKHDVFSTKRIIAVTYVKVMKWYDYGYLEEIVVRRKDQQLYKFKEGDFPRLNLRDIEDLRVVILKRVEDLQLGVESYQKKLNITRPETFDFCDGTLSSIQKVLPDIASSFEMDYLPKRRWSKLDRKRSRIMIKAIDQQLFERRLIRNLEKFVGGGEYKEDFRLL
ncbi:hypothetical protein Tco_0875500 [Tanacetum coccineum]|uniref:Uncharacterized protein n=1 Tax=Tanacetum coccineum TaxID=301880 RepID=A0ABQ5BVA4_9ASTR